ncbi:hypothetical protein HMN09_01195000 [Mycena chlorophos]|uniref:Uncharacterized protein n=1 Tax=Mycena chlorophos TaxID=658473 RepID=A0A8H6S8D8_MYCCL|nr:hypothetical protein HMN09_01195000 [Mycena chlorophos]
MTRDSRPLPKRRRLNAPQQPAIAPQSNLKVPAPPGMCVSCHRLNALHLVTCARCGNTTCTVCSRTCTAVMPSPPPTPHLSWTPTPSSSPTESPRKSVLALTNMNLDPSSTASTPTVKRKKPAEAEEEREGGGGCGRVVCKDCAYSVESLQESSTTCYDCYGH